MPFRFARRVRNLEIKTYCPTKKKDLTGGGSGRGSGSQQICPSCVLPIVVAFIFGFTVVQLIVIHRTIVAYKSRSLKFEQVYGPSHNDTKSQGDLLAFSKKFDAAWLIPINSSRGVEWKPEQSYPYKVPGGISRAAHYSSPINHIWKVGCPEVPTKLHGNISIDIKKDVSLDELTKANREVLSGGRWTPKDCKPRFHVALIIPYRYRWNHLKLLLSVLHPMLRRQEMSYQIFVAEQYGNYTFNKGLLMNAAFLLALNYSSSFDCVIFHDVDLLPESDRNIYGCANSPSHMSVSIDAYGYRLPYSKLVGGVFAITVHDFIQVNGYSNLYWGWGAEDDDMYKRLIANQLSINRPNSAKYKHVGLQGARAPNKFIQPLIKTARVRFPNDGLTTCHFRLVSSSAQALFTHLLVDVGEPSYSVLHIPLESMMPPSASSHHNNNPSLQKQQQHHHHTHPSPSLQGESRERLHHHHHLHQQQKRSAESGGGTADNSNSSSRSFSSHRRGTQPTSISHRESALLATSASINNNNGETHFSTATNPNPNKEGKENELFILSGIARDAEAADDKLHFPPSPIRERNTGKRLIKSMGVFSPEGEYERENHAGLLNQHFSSQPLSSSSSSSAAEERQGQQQRGNNNGRMWLSGEIGTGDRRENPQSSSVSDSVRSRAGGDIPLDPDVPVMQDEESEEEDDDETL